MTTPYTTVESLVDQFGEDELIQLTDRIGSGTIDEEVIQQAINSVSAWVDTQLGSRYSTPLATPLTDDAIAAVNELVRHQLYVHEAPDEIHERQRDAKQYFTDLRDGRAVLQGQTAAVNGESTAAGRRDMVFTDSLINTMPGAM